MGPATRAGPILTDTPLEDRFCTFNAPPEPIFALKIKGSWAILITASSSEDGGRLVTHIAPPKLFVEVEGKIWSLRASLYPRLLVSHPTVYDMILFPE